MGERHDGNRKEIEKSPVGKHWTIHCYVQKSPMDAKISR